MFPVSDSDMLGKFKVVGKVSEASYDILTNCSNAAFRLLILILTPFFFCIVFQIDYFNNKVICDLIEQNRKGILSILDEGCRNIGNVSDQVKNQIPFLHAKHFTI